MIKCPYCDKIQTDIIEDAILKAPILKCCKCDKSFVYQRNASRYNVYGLSINEGFEMEQIPELWGDNEKVMEIYEKWLSRETE